MRCPAKWSDEREHIWCQLRAGHEGSHEHWKPRWRTVRWLRLSPRETRYRWSNEEAP